MLLALPLATAIRDEARRTGLTVSASIEAAWAAARTRIARLSAPLPVPQDLEIPQPPATRGRTFADARAEVIYRERFRSEAHATFPLVIADEILEDMIDESFRLARPLGWLVERAWCIALDAAPVAPEAWWTAEAAGDTMPIARVVE